MPLGMMGNRLRFPLRHRDAQEEEEEGPLIDAQGEWKITRHCHDNKKDMAKRLSCTDNIRWSIVEMFK